jgi:peroxiredoxin
MKRLVISLLLTGWVLNFAAVAEAAQNSLTIAPKTGYLAPALELPDLTGKLVKLDSFRASKPVILLFFTSWSKTCQAEISLLQIMYAKKKANLEIVAVSFDKKKQELLNYINQNQVPFPVLLDKSLSSLDKFQVLIIPTTFCINRSGVIEKVFIDYDENVAKSIISWLK